jgi:hypothetical protein
MASGGGEVPLKSTVPARYSVGTADPTVLVDGPRGGEVPLKSTVPARYSVGPADPTVLVNGARGGEVPLSVQYLPGTV